MFKALKRVVIFFFFLAGFFLTANFALAGVDVGAGFVAGTGLTAADPRIVISRIIQILLGFLGVIAIGLIMYGGFVWMTSSGDESRVQNAKDILRNAIIGLAIILSAFGIVTFILSRILDATGSGSNTGSSSRGVGGSGVLGSCSVESVYPPHDQREVPRNTSIMITFKEEVNSATICAAVDAGGRCNGSNILTDGTVKIYKSSDEPSAFLTNVKVYDTPDHKTFVFVPGEYLGSPSEYLWYTVHLGSEISKPDGRSIFEGCQIDYMEWSFEVSNKIDLTPPQVKDKGVFPPPDNGRDTISVLSSPAQAAANVTVLSQPNVYTAAVAGAVTRLGGAPSATVAVDPNCSESGTLRVVLQTDGLTAQLSNGGRLLGSAVFSGLTVFFDGVLSLTLSAAPAAGNSWDIPVTAVRPADTLTVGQMVYVFVAAPSSPNHIKPGGSLNQTASNIAAVVNDHPDVGATAAGSVVNIKATLAGERGNDVVLATSDQTALKIASLSGSIVSSLAGGSDRTASSQVVSRRDQPMNSAIQINFNEAVSPITVVGTSDQVANYLRVVNAVGGAAGGAACSVPSDCRSYKCESNVCVGNVLAGKFKISNQYRTVEFVSDNQCGVNGCGDPIYCLPANSQLRVEVVAAGLATCGSQTDCASKTPYTSCSTQPQSGSLQLCRQDFGGNYTGSRARNYPVSNTSFDGVMDSALNSLDGDRNTFADGPINMYSDNPKVYSANAQCQADFDRIISAVNNKRVEQNKTLGDITSPFWAAGPCGTPADCEIRMRSVMQALGVPGSIKDAGGALFYFSEKEDGTPGGACRHDELSSANCNGGAPVSIPFYFCAEGDSYSWTFFISDKMDTNPPVLESITPARGSGISVSDEISGEFGKIMMSSSLSTGETRVDNGQEIAVHKNLNIWSLAGKAVGYWIESEGIDSNADGEIEKTKVYIRHNDFDGSVSYRSQMGSGIKDIYQNCYKPSAGPDCAGVNGVNPSCCNGTATANLDQNGNCR